jgi:hypothetical protein
VTIKIWDDKGVEEESRKSQIRKPRSREDGGRTEKNN